MPRIKHRTRSLVPHIVAIAVMSILIGTIALLSHFPTVCEAITLNINQYLAVGIGRITSWLPFSLFEFVIIFCIIFSICCITIGIVQLCKRRPMRALKSILRIVTMALAVGLIYSLFATFPYHRSTIPLPYSDTDYNAAAIENVVEYYVNDFNALADKLGHNSDSGFIKSTATYTDIATSISSEYKRLDVYNYYYKYTPRAKPILNNWLMNSSRILGITFLPTAEAHYNRTAPPTDVACTIAHELAHAKGVMREGDANMTAYYLLLTSSDDYLRYCGYINSFWLIQNMWRMNNPVGHESTAAPYTRLSPAITREMNANSDYWSNMDSVFDKISSLFNDIYLKLNGAADGSDSYWDSGDSDVTVDKDGNVLINARYSRTEKMLFSIYENSLQ